MTYELQSRVSTLKSKITNLRTTLPKPPKIAGIQPPVPPPPGQMEEIHNVLVEGSDLMKELGMYFKYNPQGGELVGKCASFGSKCTSLIGSLPKLPKLLGIQPPMPPTPGQMAEIHEALEEGENLTKELEMFFKYAKQ